jgi:hypothetical protein
MYDSSTRHAVCFQKNMKMKQREITDENNVKWQCVQAFAGIETERIENDEGKVPVVCTPSGGAQTVRLDLSKNWLEKMPDDALSMAIEQAKGIKK